MKTYLFIFCKFFLQSLDEIRWTRNALSVKTFLKDSQKDTAHTMKAFTFLIVSEDNISTDLWQKRKLAETWNADEM